MTFRLKFRQPSPAALPPMLAALRNLAARTLRKPRPARRLELVETLPLGGKRQLLLVTCNGQSYLIGAGADSVSTIVPAVRIDSTSSVPVDSLSRNREEFASEGSLLQ